VRLPMRGTSPVITPTRESEPQKVLV
jgi:hypothetical protein